MSKRSRLARLFAPVMSLAVAPWVFADTPVRPAESARLATFAQPSGEKYFALSLTPSKAVAAAAKNEVVILFDTSASQAGAYREDSFSTLTAMLKNLSPEDRVHLVAVDVKAVPMTKGFVAPQGEAIEAALAKLQNRTPLGATDLEVGLRSAIGTYSEDKSAARSVVYLGDGMSKANLLAGDSFGKLVTDLAKNQVSVSSFAIGKERNVALLATLANHTGGMVSLDSDEADATEAGGERLAGAVRGTVIWPTNAKLPEGLAESYPSQMPPLRTDRDTVIVGKLSEEGPQSITLEGEAHGEAVELTWQTSAEAPNPDFAFLPKLVETAERDGGLTLPTAGSAGLREAAVTIAGSAIKLTELGHQALASGNKEGAAAAADAALARDPSNPEALALREVAKRDQVEAPAAAAGEDNLTLEGKTNEGAKKESSLLEEALAEGTGSIDNYEAERSVNEGRIKAEIQRTLSEARRSMGDNPKVAEQDLKLAIDSLNRASDVSGEVRAQLKSQLESAIREAARTSKIADDQNARNSELAAAARERERLLDETALNQQRLKQVMDRFAGLMEEKEYAVAEDEALPEVMKLAGNSTIGESVNTGGRLQRHFHELADIQIRKDKNFLASMMQLELSHIPFPDEPPIVYPSAERWEEISRKRKKYSAVDLGRKGGREQKIFDELERQTTLDFVDTPLKEVVDTLAANHDISIVLNTTKLRDASIEPEVQVTKSLKGISLRSALRLMLTDLGLTYVVRDEVLQITTPEDAEGQLITKVYPVGDLVVPIQVNTNLFGLGGSGLGGGGMGGLGGGMGGGFGGGGGGMGGMGGGMGGGGMGGMGGGMGGGLFDVEDSLSLGTNKAPEAKPAKKTNPAEVKPAISGPISKASALKLPAGGSWDSLMAAKQEGLREEKADSPRVKQFHADVRQTVRTLMEQKKFDDVSNLIQASLRHGHVQPWMYEALGLALQANQASSDDLERALMSAVDFASSEEEILFIATYMDSVGLHDRAFQLCKQIGTANPSRTEAFTRALEIAQRSKDPAAIAWACTGLLRESWPEDQRVIGEYALRTAKVALAELQKANKSTEAKAFQKSLTEASARDVVVRVTWSGDADIDVSVQEPSGTVCNARNPRTTSGGVFMGDMSAADVGAGKACGETYVCGEGFDGKYSVSLKNIWGKPAGGKVTIDIFTGYNTPSQTVIHEHIPLGDKNAVVNFELKEGRRKEALPEARVAQVAKIQNAVNRGVLAQQLAGMQGNSTSQNYLRSLMISQQLSGNGNNGFFGRGAVGYRPVITTLPEGANFSSNAVISADRRYVRVSPAPTFSNIAEVNTFNFVSGQGGTQQNGQGGGGSGGFGGGAGGAGGGGFF